MRALHGLTAFCGLILAASLAAQATRDDGGSARFQAMIQQLTQEKTQLTADNAKLKGDLDKAKAELEALRGEQAGLQRRLGQSEASLNQSNASNSRNAQLVEQQRARLEELVAQFRQTIEQLRALELERNDLKVQLASRESALNQCATNNQKLFETGNEVLDRYEQKGCFAAMRENEPFMQLKRVQFQNLVDEYRWALEDQKLPESALPVPESESAAPPAGEGASP
jgi:chromosome segregation ATPase